MSPLFKKLNLKNQRAVLVHNSPLSFESALTALEAVPLFRDPDEVDAVDFALAFATKQSEVDSISELLGAKAEGDAVLWFAYPKATSKLYRCEFNRDNGWSAMRALGFDTVRQVAIDADWSALRFRRSEFVGR